jgi:hypothetical protein
MLKLDVGRLLEAFETMTIERGHFESAAKVGGFEIPWHHYAKLITAVSDVERISREAKLASTQQAAARTKQFLEQGGRPPDGRRAVVSFQSEGCGNAFRHLMDITSRIRDDCHARLYFQMAHEDAELMRDDVAHFGAEVEKIFGPASEDIAEAAACLALGRTTACVFHLMRAMEGAVLAMAKRLRAKRLNRNGQMKAWGALLSEIDKKIAAMKPSPKKDEWHQARVLLEAVNRAWRVKVAHPGSDLRPKETYTQGQARVCFDSTKAFMNYLADLIEKRPARPQLAQAAPHAP